ncbi:MAG: DUF4160 domain-containing protein [Actinobacteria bacterium]|nr:DUF4160 domain-containing protein [Actinomycetota bacterium]
MVVSVSTSSKSSSNLTRKQIRMVCDWAALHQVELEENWQRARAGATFRSIEPWR